MRRLSLKSEARCIVAADFKPPLKIPLGERRNYVERQLLTFADKVAGLGIILKVNSALRLLGYGLLVELHVRGLLSFADLKLCDIDDTLTVDGMLLEPFRPHMVTVMCGAGVAAMHALRVQLPDTEILGVTVLTSLLEGEIKTMFACSSDTPIEEVVLRLAESAKDANLESLVSSAKEVAVLRGKFGALMSLNTPAIRPAWSVVPGDGQNPDRIVTPAQAIDAGADRIVIGRPITLSENPREAVLRTIEEIDAAVKA